MKKILLTTLQFLLFLVTFAAGSFLRPFDKFQVLSVTPEGTHVFIWDGALLMALLFVIILAIEALRGRLRTSSLWTLLAFALAAALGLAAKFGFMTR